MNKDQMYRELDSRLKWAALGLLMVNLGLLISLKRINDLEDSMWKYASSSRVNGVETILWHPAVRELLEEKMSEWADRMESDPPRPVSVVPQAMRAYPGDRFSL